MTTGLKIPGINFEGGAGGAGGDLLDILQRLEDSSLTSSLINSLYDIFESGKGTLTQMEEIGSSLKIDPS